MSTAAEQQRAAQERIARRNARARARRAAQNASERRARLPRRAQPQSAPRGVGVMTASLHTLTPIERFWSKVEKTEGHWLWRGYITPSGWCRADVGRVARGPERRTRSARLLAWELTVGPLGSDRTLRRVCDEPLCIRPACHRRTWDREPLPLDLPPPEPPALPPRELPWLPPLRLAQLRWEYDLGTRPSLLAARFELDKRDVERLARGEAPRRGQAS
jgi:hypothetical protein